MTNTTATDASKLPLAGIRVMDVATVIAAPYCATVLGEFGADVLKVEHPVGGDALRRFGTPSKRGDTLTWMSEARNKRSVTLDLRRPEGVEVFKQLIAKTDVLCENFRTGTLEKWGLGWDVLHEINPGLIMLRVTGYGQTGPYKNRPGFARVAHAVGGIAYLAGMPKGTPVTPGSTTLGDYMTGLYGCLGVLMALRHRERTGEGQYVDAALYESVFRARIGAGVCDVRHRTRTIRLVAQRFCLPARTLCDERRQMGRDLLRNGQAVRAPRKRDGSTGVGVVEHVRRTKNTTGSSARCE